MSRHALQTCLAQKDYDFILRLASHDKRVLSDLLALTYSADDVEGWRAVKALGLAAAQVAETDPEFVRNILRRLLWSLNDESGSIGWRAPQALGAIIAQHPGQFAEFIPIVVSLLDLDETHFYPGILWAIAHIAEQDADCIRFALPQVRTYLSHLDPMTRGMAVWCLARLGADDSIAHFLTDSAALEVFVEDSLQERTIGELAREALARQDPWAGNT